MVARRARRLLWRKIWPPQLLQRLPWLRWAQAQALAHLLYQAAQVCALVQQQQQHNGATVALQWSRHLAARLLV